MAKRNKKNKRRKSKPVHETVRNWTAVAAHFATGGGKHGDRRFRRKRTRAAQEKAAIAEYR